MSEIKVLDLGFVQFKGILDGDSGVTESARVSYKSESKNEDEDRKLIAYLWIHQHGTPFEHAVFKFHIKAPLFVARQWFRHRMASYNETSFRYREAQEEFYIPKSWRSQQKGIHSNKQGSTEGDLKDRFLTKVLKISCENSMSNYRSLLGGGVAREMARIVLPVNLYTEFYWTVNARSLMNFIDLRSDNHAQWEIRQYSHALSVFFKEHMPWTWDVFLQSLKEKKNRNYLELEEYVKSCGK